MNNSGKYIKNILEIVFTVLVTLAAQFILAAVGYWNNNNKFDGFFNSQISLLKSSLIISISVIVVIIISKQAIANRENTIIGLKAQLDEKQRHLELTANALYGKYGELARNNYTNMFKSLLQSFIMNNDLVESIQIYKYHVINKNYKYGTKSYKQVAIKVESLIGMAKEGVNINALMQTYYEVDFDVYMDIQKISEYYQKILEYRNDVNDIGYAEFKKLFVDDSSRLLENLLDKLNNIVSARDIREKHFTYYRICHLLSSLLNNIDYLNDTSKNFNGTNIQTLVNNAEIEKILSCNMRTGILGSIFIKNMYSFMNVKSQYKQKRMYLTSTINFKGENFVLLISLPPTDWSTKIDWNNEFCRLIEDFNQKYKSLL